MDSSQVHARTDEHNDRIEPSSCMGRTSVLLSLLEAKWEGVQVSRQGSYSIERLESLHHYCETTSTTRVILVCILTPLPALALALLLEFLPLQPPSGGWAANWVFWIRVTAICFLLAVNGMLVVRRLVVGLPLTWDKILVVTTVVAAGFTGFALMVAVVVGFPVPFVMCVGAIPNALLIGMMLVLTLGIAPFRSSSSFHPDLTKFYKFLFDHETLFAVYPLVKVLYSFVPTKYQGLAMLVLPIWKFAAKQFVGRSIRDMEDYVPQIVAFNVDYFSTLFVSVCMYNSGSITVSVLAIFVDVLLSLLEFREVRKNANIVYKLLQGHVKWSYSHLDYQENESLLLLTLQVARNPEAHNIKSFLGVRLWANYPHSLSSERFDELKKLEALDAYSTSVKHRVYLRKQPQCRVAVAPAIIYPSVNSVENLTLAQTGLSASRSNLGTVLGADGVANTERSKKLMIQGLQLLFHTEYLALVEYIECVVPLVFLSYKSVLQQLPNVVYAPSGTEGWHNVAVGNILLFAVLEIISFLGLIILLQRKFTFSPLYQLAYVLETQVELVQFDVLIATLVLLPCELEHFARTC